MIISARSRNSGKFDHEKKEAKVPVPEILDLLDTLLFLIIQKFCVGPEILDHQFFGSTEMMCTLQKLWTRYFGS
jgi:hypothetical protein